MPKDTSGLTKIQDRLLANCRTLTDGSMTLAVLELIQREAPDFAPTAPALALYLQHVRVYRAHGYQSRASFEQIK